MPEITIKVVVAYDYSQEQAKGKEGTTTGGDNPDSGDAHSVEQFRNPCVVGRDLGMASDPSRNRGRDSDGSMVGVAVHEGAEEETTTVYGAEETTGATYAKAFRDGYHQGYEKGLLQHKRDRSDPDTNAGT